MRFPLVLTLALCLSWLPRETRADGFLLDQKKNPVDATVHGVRGAMQARLYSLTDKEVKFTTRKSAQMITWLVGTVKEVETMGMRFVYDPKLKLFTVTIEGVPSSLQPPIKPIKPTRPRQPKTSEPDQPEDRNDEVAMQRYRQALRTYERERELLEHEFKRALDEFPAVMRNFEKELAEWPARQAAEKARVLKLAGSIRDVERQFDGKVKFAAPIDGHTTEGVEAFRLELKRLGR